MEEKEFILFIASNGQALARGYGYLSRMADEGLLKEGSVKQAYHEKKTITEAFKDEETRGEVDRILARGNIPQYPLTAFRAEVLDSIRLEKAAAQFCKLYDPADFVVYRAHINPESR